MICYKGGKDDAPAIKRHVKRAVKYADMLLNEIDK